MSVAKDAESARCWIVSVGTHVLEAAMEHSRKETALLDKVSVIAACAELQDEAVIRVRCQPGIFGFRC